ncbi:hypothetical protein [Microbacterium imperiale]|uniref:Uncharacterized protein n=1 Tax=Microbacterium imperiale TaxID=33884 RepID=A0A9W6HEQ5_9MICO|nr:hypothetical protein [Microbacterium imperiale]MBP2419983.1 hypothetical protein [Microbacterium imperiale]MDS0198153.1 hypothetical protein [Microbacterium imperiale]BFE40325.1 hypothetical protein GCM10017544_12810 [Microbacterium imperiale]GLJ78699.1 hypothetical protein GCM10017586_03810 [Microbacterium imperiale]
MRTHSRADHNKNELRRWLESAVMVCMIAGAIATVTYRLGVIEGQHAILRVVCEQIELIWDPAAQDCAAP